MTKFSILSAITWPCTHAWGVYFSKISNKKGNRHFKGFLDVFFTVGLAIVSWEVSYFCVLILSTGV